MKGTKYQMILVAILEMEDTQCNETPTLKIRLAYPVWACDSLDFPDNERETLAHLLHQLSNERKDFQYNSPVQDIIDPDICPYIIQNPGATFLRL